MKLPKGLLCLILVVLLAWGEQVCAAVTVTNISKSDFDTLLSQYQASFSVKFLGGGDSGFGSEEIEVAQSTAFPQLGGSSTTIIGNLPSNSGVRWSQPITDIHVTLDNLSYVSARAASTLVAPTWAVVRPTNQFLILTADMDIFGSSSTVASATFNGSNVRNLFADGNGSYAYDAVSVTGFDMGGPIDYNATWAPGPFPGGNFQYVWIVGLNNTSIPEPSTCFLTIFSAVLLFVRRRD
ncbi:MAG: hypothetical protein RLZZ517_571 [Candidatus Parcubacteria bacterium]|jgi:hypothetical protein